MTRARWLGCALLLATLTRCSDQIPPPNPSAFDRPNRVAFACFQTSGRGDPKPLPMRLCKDSFFDVPGKPDISLHALVAQTTRGEIAAVDLEDRRVLDNRRDVPGPTFVAAGELPSAIVVPPYRPRFTYVASAGSRDLRVLRTVAFRERTPGESATVQIVKLRPDAAGDAVSPTDMVLSPDEDALFVVSASSGTLLRVPIVRCPAPAADGSGADTGEDAGTSDAGAPCVDGLIDEAGITQIDLAASAGLVSAPAAASAEEEPYRLACPQTPLLPVRETEPVELPSGSPEPEPVAIAVDAFCREGEPCTRRLVIADRALPFLHVVDIDAASVLAPLVTGTPTDAVVVSPRVPVEVDASSSDETRYVYAIDHTDGSVLVLQDGRVLTVTSDPVGRADRISFGTAITFGAPIALSLEVLTPDFDVTGPAAQYAEPDPDDDDALACPAADVIVNPRVLHGVFLAVGLSDGTVRIVDVHDMEIAECRTCPASGNAKPPFPVIRHRTRIANTQSQYPSAALASSVTPQFAIDRYIGVQSDGTTNDPRVPGLQCVPCADPLSASFPNPNQASDVVDDLIDAGSDASLDTGADASTDAGLDAALDAALDAGIDEETPDAGAAEGGAFCQAGSALVCAVADPWSTPQLWTVEYEGVIPSTGGGQGRFTDVDAATQTVTFASEVRFCDKGVLGDDELDDRGDQLVITSKLPPSASFDDDDLRKDCETLVRARDDGENLIAFRIRRAYDDRLILDQRLRNPPSELPRSRRDYAFVERCFANNLMTFEVRTRDAFRVFGARSGFIHGVETSSAGRCRNASDADPRLTARARDGAPFDNGLISFQIATRKDDEGNRVPPTRGTWLRLDFGPSASQVALNAQRVGFQSVSGVLPVDLAYSPADQRLYVVDMTARGLIPVSLEPFPTEVSSSYD